MTDFTSNKEEQVIKKNDNLDKSTNVKSNTNNNDFSREIITNIIEKTEKIIEKTEKIIEKTEKIFNKSESRKTHDDYRDILWLTGC